MAKKKTVELEDGLNSVYNNIVDMRTTCQGRTCCCKIAMPQLNMCEWLSIITDIWDNWSNHEKVELICKSLEYFFKNEFEKYGMETLVKPCMLLSDEGKCVCYLKRPLSCRLYGLWPEKMYKERVDKFEAAYEGLLKREEIPLNTQCPYVERINDEEEITEDLINAMYKALDDIDFSIGEFSKNQIKNKENYRTFHDWLLLKVFGEDKLSSLTTFMLGADKETIDDQIEQFKNVIRDEFGNHGAPEVR